MVVAIGLNPDVGFSINAEAESGMIALGAGLAIGLSAIGAGVGLGTAAASAAAAITEKPESFGKLLVLLALIEAIAIYGFVIAFVLAGNIA
ncbi:MAG TPA: ATP synthase subunit C [Candidatus Bathyarchaeia archaeon]|nr:ATP synthase subunit C [Candidatus Bathyarchaeia archaeon]